VNVIKEAKRVTCNKRILESNNKSKSTWNIINEMLSKQHSMNAIQKLTVEGSHLTNQHDIAEAFNNYFSSVMGKINSTNINNMRHKDSSSTYSY
jgi:ribosomal protein L23